MNILWISGPVANGRTERCLIFDVFKTSLTDVFKTYLKDDEKQVMRRLKDVKKISSRHFYKTS